MVNFSKGIIYKICCKDVTVKEIYIGSTSNLLKDRKSRHKSCCNNSTNKGFNYYVYQYIRKNGGFDNFDIVEIERYPCSDRQELNKRERYWIELLQSTLNKQIPTRTLLEYRQDNRAHLLENHKIYYQDNKENLTEKKKQKIKCECGCLISRVNISRHIKSKKHINLLQALQAQ